MGCTFCFTGTQKIKRNLTPAEIVSQLLVSLLYLNHFPNSMNKFVQSIVFMGQVRFSFLNYYGFCSKRASATLHNQGEPFFNYGNVKKAIGIIADGEGLSFSKKKITVSTSGVVPMIHRFSSDEELHFVQLAVSLHSVNDAVRDQLIPINKQVFSLSLFP